MKQTNVLFISRNFPPSTGGMQEYAYHLHEQLQDDPATRVTAYTWGGENIGLPVILPYFAVMILYQLLIDDIDVLYLTDGVLAPFGAVYGAVFPVKTVVTLHGLDVTYTNMFYQHLVVPAFSRIDRFVCVSSATQKKAVDSDIPGEKLSVIPPGVDPSQYYRPDVSRDTFTTLLSEEKGVNVSADATILLSVGRVVERKGFHWFAEQVIPALDDDTAYIVCGEGPLRDGSAQNVADQGLDNQVHFVGFVSDELLTYGYNVADMLVMPNISVDGDMEGFGIVAVEASSCGTPVLAADMEGMKDSVVQHETGLRVEPEDVDSFADGVYTLLDCSKSREDVRQFTIEQFSWERQGEKYLALFNEVAQT